MKKSLLVTLSVFLIVSCKKVEFSPEGPTDIRILNSGSKILSEVRLKTSENDEDTANLGDIGIGSYSEYFRFKKAYLNIEISARVMLDNKIETFTTGPVDFTYLHFIGQDRVTFKIGIDIKNNKINIIDRKIEEPLVLK
jgi:hypothetical protein